VTVPEAPGLEQRVGRLTQDVERLAARVERLEAALAARRVSSAAAPSDPASEAERDAATAAAVARAVADGEGLLALAGRTLITLGGAFLLRAASEGAYLPPAVGALAGLVYALAWLWAAEREARGGRRLSAGFHCFATLAIGYPLIAEATLRFAALSAATAALAALCLLAATLVVAVRHALPVIAGISTAAAALTELTLLIGGRELAGPGAALLGLAVLVEVLTHHGRWPGLRWLAAAAADLGITIVALLLTRPAGLPQGWAPLPGGLGLALLLGLPVLYLVSTAARTLARGRPVSPFEILQASLTSVVGFGGAWRAVAVLGGRPGLLGLPLLLLAAGSYGVAFAFLERRAGLLRNFYTYGTFGAAAMLAGSAMVFSGRGLGLWLSALALVILWLGLRYERSTLRLHASLYFAAATVPVGMLGSASSGLFGSADRLPSAAALAVALAAAAGYALTAVRRPPWTLAGQIARTLLAVLVLVALPGLLVDALAQIALAASPAAAEAAIDAMRMVVLSGLAVGLAWAGPRWRLPELGWCVYPVLLGAGLHLLVHGLGHGRALTLFISLAAFGSALLLTPRLARDESGAGEPGA